jgi:hypothetical protein
MKSITDYTKIISITATLLLCAGIISQTVYYFLFNIPITEFLSLSEVLLLFTQDIIRYIIIFLILLLISLIFNYNKPKSYYKRFFIEYCQIKTLGTRVRKYLSNKTSSLIYYIMGTVCFFSLLSERSKTVYLFGLYFSIDVIYFFIKLLLFENRRTLRLKRKLIKDDNNFALFFTFGLHFLFFVICWSLVDVENVKYRQKFINVSFKLSDTLMRSDSTKYYVGQTEKYLFYYNSKLDMTTVFKKEDISEMYFGKINYFQFDIKKK